MFFKKYGTKIIVSCCRARMPLEHFVLFLFLPIFSKKLHQAVVRLRHLGTAVENFIIEGIEI